jgi:site-specific recombinase XerD
MGVGSSFGFLTTIRIVSTWFRVEKLGLFVGLTLMVGTFGATSHSGRRTYATNIASQGVGLRVLMRLMGHRNVSTTAVYIDANDDMLRKAAELA